MLRLVIYLAKMFVSLGLVETIVTLPQNGTT